MTVIASRQWTLPASISFACASTRYAMAALEYRDCIVIKLWRCNDQDNQADMSNALELLGHKERVHFACFHPTTDFLCTVSTDCVLVWQIINENGILYATRNILIDNPKMQVNCVTFDATGALIAIALFSEVQVIQVQTSALFVTLEGHMSKITTCLFHPLKPHVLVTASEDRTFKVWDLSNQKLIYQSAILSAYSILHLCIHPSTGDIACAFGDGQLRVFDTNRYSNELASVNIAQYLDRIDKKKHVAQQMDKVLDSTQNVVSSLPPWARSQRASESAQARAFIEANAKLNPIPVILPGTEHLLEPMQETTCTILGLAYLSSDSSTIAMPKPFNSHDVEPLHEATYTLVIPTINYLLSINAFSYDIQVLHCFQDELPIPIGIAKQTAICTFGSLCDVWIISAFIPRLTYLQITCAQQQNNQEKVVLSMFPQTLPPAISILTQTFNRAPIKKSSKLDQPITFRKSIKSSGYGSEKPKAMKFKGLPKKTSKPTSDLPNHLKEYPVDANLISQLEKNAPHHKIHELAINQIEYSNDGKKIATASNDKLGQIISTSKPNSHVFVGHDKAVRSIHWSHSSNYLLTASNDGTARVWVDGSDVHSLLLPTSKQSKLIEITDANFFYMDKFIALAVGNALKLIQYDIDMAYAQGCISAKKTKKKAIEALENHSSAKTMASFRFENVQTLTGIACANAFLSHLIVATCSDRSIRIIDVAQSKTVRTIENSHSRPAHSIVLPRASSYVSHPPNYYDLMLTGACDSTVHLWDIRADNCVMRFAEHANRVHIIGLAFSPCMRYVVSGSEDKVAYMYDIRMGRSIVKLHGHTDVVSSIAFNPLKTQLVTAAFDGSIRFYNECTRQEE
ncbi:hypothetical protein THRCLA_11123 [Thraustotheca clavata]|uniref:Uncharacterized protein n=1 Tax=Thraustotheca clavata TaxID=74557 RepID=A0A1V9Y8Q1_9STRA|nr:hypothetical protein THRCLA_11123 [Thraustotheca clavata]